MAVKPKPSAPLNNYNCSYFPDRVIGYSDLCKCYPCYMKSVILVNTGSSFEYVKMTGPLKPSPILTSPTRPAQEIDLTCKEQFCRVSFVGKPGQEFCSFDCEMWHEVLCKKP